MSERKKNEIARMTDEELEDYIKKMPRPKVIDEAKKIIMESVKAEAEAKLTQMKPKHEGRIEKYDTLAKFISEATAKAMLEEDKMLLVYGHCYTAVLYTNDEEGNPVGMEFVVSFRDPREHPEYKDRIIKLRRCSVKQGGLKEEIL